MTTFFISRHPGAIEWVNQQGIAIDRFEAHLHLDDVAAGDTVVGTLPIPMVFALSQKGVRYLHLSVELPASFRGQELSAEQMMALGASLQGYKVEAL